MSRHRTLIFAAATLPAALWALSCGDGATEPPPDPPRPTTVTVSPATAELTALDATVQLRAQVLDQYGQVMAGAAVSWSSSAASVAAVDGSGLVTAAGNGAATITATAGSPSGTAVVTVAQRVSTVEVSPAADTVVERDTVRFVAQAMDANGHVVAAAEFAWSSSDTSVAAVDGSGLVTGTGAGEVEVTATSSGVTGGAGLVVEAPVPTTLTVAPDTLEFTALADTVRLMAEVRDQIGRVMEAEPVAWSSADTMVAVVDSTGLVTAAGNGAATITATAGGVSGIAVVTVAQRVSTVEVSPAADTVVERDTVRFVAQAMDANGHVVAAGEFAWSSSDTSVAVVDGSGLVTGTGAGEVEVTATSSGVVGGAQLTVVVPAPTMVAVTPDTVAMTALGQTAQLTAQVRDQAGRVMEGVPASWSSADTTVAAVDSAGLLTAAGIGTTTITATAGEASGKAVVTVMQSAGSVIVSPSADTVVLGDSLQLIAEAFDENGHRVEGAQFDWSSSAVSVARVDGSGLVTAVAKGTATITATAGDARGTAEITVQNPDRAALAALYNATDGPNWVSSDNWLTDAPLREWYGVETDGSGRVVRLDLSGWWDSEAHRSISHGLSGPIPPELGNLSELTHLSLDRNGLTGAIRPELGSLANLTRLALNSNALAGSIPSELGNLSELTHLLLDHNNLTGGIPPELGKLASLTALSLTSNPLEGSIPPELGNLTNLRRLSLWTNSLTGSIPPELGNLASLMSLSLGGNYLTGPIPPEFGNLSELTFLGLAANYLTGPIPPELGKLTSLTTLDLRGNADVGRNRLTGPIPHSFLQLGQLTRFYLGGTELCTPQTSPFIAWLQGIEDHDAERGSYCNAGDVAALKSLYEATGGSDWTESSGWLGDGVLAEWYGVSADSLGRVTGLDLTRNGLAGELPVNLGHWARMTTLRIDGNALTGRLPLSLAQVPLQDFFYADTQLCAPAEETFERWLNTIPSHEGTGVQCAPLSDRDLLEALYKATGGPGWTNNADWLTEASLGRWYGVDVDGQGRVTSIDLSQDNLTGPIPPELGNLTSLANLLLNDNDLTGPIPGELGNLASLTTLSLRGNELTGPIPPELGNLARLGVCAAENRSRYL